MEVRRPLVLRRLLLRLQLVGQLAWRGMAAAVSASAGLALRDGCQRAWHLWPWELLPAVRELARRRELHLAEGVVLPQVVGDEEGGVHASAAAADGPRAVGPLLGHHRPRCVRLLLLNGMRRCGVATGAAGRRASLRRAPGCERRRRDPRGLPQQGRLLRIAVHLHGLHLDLGSLRHAPEGDAQEALRRFAARRPVGASVADVVVAPVSHEVEHLRLADAVAGRAAVR
mmetsp:Transcript_24770/g.71592  ORF Transcript_24770/g.71592 Transcript_24770/m.71592 type:complete len:228 (-) Transcript_24770:98-781(-)